MTLHTINAWFTLVGGLVEEHGVEWENIWGADETGVELGEAGKERVIGPSGKNNQKRTSSGNHQNVTVMATIGACGRSLPPFVIYKGQAFQVKWFQNNPSNAMLSYSAKGYMTGEVSLDWIKHFDRHTSAQAQHGAKARLLLVDGHVSHYTLELLNYARDHNIILACYPSHTTHVLQGLDVACFGRLKQLYSRYAHELEDRTGYPITKENFLIPFSRAYTETFTPETIASAFSKTGIHPFNPNIIPASAMAPSLPTSTQSSLPLTLPTAVARLAEMWNIDPQLLENAPEGVPVDTDIEGMGAEIPGNSGDNVQHEASATQGNSAHHLTGNLHEALANTSAEFLVNNAPITSEDQLEPVPFHYLPPLPASENELAALGRPTTELEKSLMAQLKAYKRRDESREAAYRGAQAHLVLAERHCSRLQSQLGAKEGRARARANGAGNERLMGDGMPRALSQGEFFEQVERLAVARAAQEAAHQQKEAEKARFKAVKTEWEAAEAARKAQNQEAHRLWKEGPLKDWLEAQEQAKAGGFRFNTPRPKAPFKLKPIPKPWLVQNTPNGAQEQPRDEDDGGSHDDGNDSEAV